MTKRARWVALVTGLMMLAFMVPAATAQGGVRTYSVTITNLTPGQPLTPPLVATHKSSVRLFAGGQPASEGLKEIAENGNLEPLMATLGADPNVSDLAVAGAGDPPPLMPGQTVTFEIQAEPGFRFLSYASMFICTNDGFTGDRVYMPIRIGRPVSTPTFAFDAGTEMNTEQFADIVPPCPALTGVESSVPGTGTSNPALAEGGVITRHAGVTTTSGSDTLLASVHGWTPQVPVAVMTVTRTG